MESFCTDIPCNVLYDGLKLNILRAASQKFEQQIQLGS